MQVSTLIEHHIHEGGFAGAALGVAQGGRIVLEHYAGFGAPGLASGPEVLFPIASITKSFTAAVVMRLVELGELTVNTYVSTMLPTFTGEGRDEVRLRHLLTHTSGLPYESPEMEARLKAQTPLSALIERLMPRRCPSGRARASVTATTITCWPGTWPRSRRARPMPSWCARSSSSRWG
jgi:CubicO group peptidase (beta-lactamase class C family)